MANSQEIDTLLKYVRTPPNLGEYERIAREDGAAVICSDVTSPCRLILKDEFRLIVVHDQIARLHCAALFEPTNDESGTSLGVSIVDSLVDLDQAYDSLVSMLVGRLGDPKGTGEWTTSVYLGCDDDYNDVRQSHPFRFAFWRFPNSILLLLMNDDGDGHIGEIATVDLRILPSHASKDLPAAGKELLGWPVEDHF